MGSDDPVNPYAPPKVQPSGGDEERVPQARLEGRKPKWATVASYGSDQRALEALRVLENERIECRLIQDAAPGDSHIFEMRPVPLGHRLQVAPEDLVEAAKLLGVDVDEVEPVNAADERMKTAFAVAVVGLIICPLVTQVISMLLVLATPSSLLTAVGRRRRRWALVVDVTVFTVVAVAAMIEK
jgi:hypothetical protein